MGLSLIVAIGAQNAFVLRQGLRNEHVFAVSLTCALSDAILIALGVAGFGKLIALAPWLDPLLVNSVVGFIGPEYLYDGKEIIRAGLEDHFCGKLLGLPLGVDVCYTNHAEADQDDMDNLLTLLAAAGVTFIMGVPGADDVMLNYQSTSFHDALYVRDLFGLKRAPEFDDWLVRTGLAGADFRLAGNAGLLPDFASRLIA